MLLSPILMQKKKYIATRGDVLLNLMTKKEELNKEQYGEQVKDRMDLSPLSTDSFQYRIDDESDAYTRSDTVSQWHQHDDQKR